jgi:RimJ/RimL family protein N-acetyltransferase
MVKDNLYLMPISTDEDEMRPFIVHEFAREAFELWQKMYSQWEYQLPWVGYFAVNNGQTVGVAGFKGGPKNNTVELAYGTVPEFEGLGFGTRICKLLVETALENNPGLRITARTLPMHSASTRILEKNSFRKLGTIEDPEDGPVWEWLYV